MQYKYIPQGVYSMEMIFDIENNIIKSLDIVKNIKSELINTEKDLKITFSETEISKKLSKQSTEKIITFLTNTKSTALKFNNKNEVLTSLNLGVVSLADNTFRASFMIRSNLKNEKEQQSDILDELVLSLGGSFEHSASYPTWEYAENSKLRETMTAAFERLYDRTPKIRESFPNLLKVAHFCLRSFLSKESASSSVMSEPNFSPDTIR